MSVLLKKDSFPVTHKAKQDLRERIQALLKNQDESVLKEKSGVIAGKWFSLDAYIQAQTVLFFASFNREVDTYPMMVQALKDGKQIALPKINTEKKTLKAQYFSALHDLEDGPYGVSQVKESAARDLLPEDVDVVLVPALAFDKKKNRLGRGGGFYDRYLGTLPKKTPTVGLAYDFQLLDSLPIDAHDIPVSFVLTG